MFLALLMTVLALAAASLFWWWVSGRTPGAEYGSVKPPVIRGLPVLGVLLRFGKNPTEYLSQLRRQFGDIYVIHVLGFRLFCIFSPEGLQDFYSFREEDASFEHATRTLLQLKLPAEMLDQYTIHKNITHVLRVSRMDGYARRIADACDRALASLRRDTGLSGRFEVFRTMKNLVHRVGFLVWIGEEALLDRYWPQLVDCFDTLDPENAFKGLHNLLGTVATNKRRERAAYQRLIGIIGDIWQERQRRAAASSSSSSSSSSASSDAAGTLESLNEALSELPEAERAQHMARSVYVLHMASGINLYAAISWVLINLLQHREAGARVLADAAALDAQHGGSRDAWLTSYQVQDKAMDWAEQCISETIRIGQRSLTLRKAMKPLTLRSSGHVIPEGSLVTTLLSVTNFDAAVLGDRFPPHEFHPDRYERDNALRDVPKERRFSVSTFGHGYHACPGKRFAMMTMKIIIVKYLGALELTPRFTAVQMLEGSLGAVGRAAHPVMVDFQFRS